MKIFLTGASGFIGHHLLKNLSIDNDVTILSREILNQQDYIDNIGDIDCFIHCASATPSNTTDPYKMVVDNIFYAKKLIGILQARKVHTFIYLSSMSVYGEMIAGCVKEDSATFNPSLYGLSKYMAEKIFSEYLIDQGIKKIFLRLPGVVGIGAKDIFLAKMRAGFESNSAVKVYNSTQLFNNVLHVNSLINYIRFIIDEINLFPEEIALNLGSIKPIEVGEVVNIFKHMIPSETQVTFGDTQKPSFLISCDRAIEYGFIPMITENSIRDYLLNI